MSAITKMVKPLLGSTDTDLYLMDGYVNISSSAAVVSETILGMSVTKTGTGEYTFTFDSNAKPASVQYASAMFVAATAVDLVAQVKSFSSTSVVVRLNAGATPTDPTAACGLLLSVHCKKSLVAR